MSGILHGVRRVLMPRGAIATSPGASVLILDAFTDTDSTSLDAHTIAPTNTPATSWALIKLVTTAGAAAARVTSNQAEVTVNSTGAVVDAGVADCTITADWTPQAAQNNRGRLVFRYSADGSEWFAYMNEPGSKYELYEYDTDTLTQRGTVDFTFVDGTTYAIKVVLSGAGMELFVDAVSKITFSSALFETETQHGIGFNTGHSGLFDNFKVTSP